MARLVALHGGGIISVICPDMSPDKVKFGLVLHESKILNLKSLPIYFGSRFSDSFMSLGMYQVLINQYDKYSEQKYLLELNRYKDAMEQ